MSLWTLHLYNISIYILVVLNLSSSVVTYGRRDKVSPVLDISVCIVLWTLQPTL